MVKKNQNLDSDPNSDPTSLISYDPAPDNLTNQDPDPDPAPTDLPIQDPDPDPTGCTILTPLPNNPHARDGILDYVGDGDSGFSVIPNVIF